MLASDSLLKKFKNRSHPREDIEIIGETKNLLSEKILYLHIHLLFPSICISCSPYFHSSHSNRFTLLECPVRNHENDSPPEYAPSFLYTKIKDFNHPENP